MTTISELDERKRQQVDDLLGRNGPVTTTVDRHREAVERHAQIVDDTRARVEANFGGLRTYAPPEPPKPRHELDCTVSVNGRSYYLFDLVRALVRSTVPYDAILAALVTESDVERMLTGLKSLGLITGFDRSDN